MKISFEINVIEDMAKIELPKDMKIATERSDLYTLSYCKIKNYDEVKEFELIINSNQLWQNLINLEIKNVLSKETQFILDTFNYFLFYNITTDEYNKYTAKRGCEIIFIAYNLDLQRVLILNNYLFIKQTHISE